MYEIVHKQMSFITLEGLSTTFEASMNVSYNTGLLTFVTDIY